MDARRSVPELRARAVAFALVARTLGADTRPLRDPEHAAALAIALTAAGEDRLAAVLRDRPTVAGAEVDELAGRWVRWFDLGRVAPYEGSNVAVTAGGITPRLADVSGFYRSLGMTVAGNRPDHVVAELEFMAAALALEAEALAVGDVDRAEVVGDVVRSFVRDHVGTWLDAWAARVAEIGELAPWAHTARIAAGLVASEASARNVIPTRSDAVLPGVEPVADDEPTLECGDAAVGAWG